MRKALTALVLSAIAFSGASALASTAASADEGLNGQLAEVTSQVNPMTDDLGVTVGDRKSDYNSVDADGAKDWGSSYGDANIAGDQHGLVNTNGAPLVHADLRCVDAMGGIGGYANSVLGNSAKCNKAPVNQYHDGGILG